MCVVLFEQKICFCHFWPPHLVLWQDCDGMDGNKKKFAFPMKNALAYYSAGVVAVN
jgi:hypothetical protein